MKKIILLFMMFFGTQLAIAQTKTVTGQVTDVNGEVLPMANVGIKDVYGQNKGTSTSFDGTFSIEAKIGDKLIISFLGYETQEVVVGEENNIKVQLKESAESLAEVVVTSLGIKREKKALTYSAQELKAEELTRVKDANIVNTAAGKIAGVAITRSSAGTGGSTKVVIRGNSSFTNSQPLYVIDGVPLYNGTSGQPNDTFGSTSGGNKDGGDVVSLLNSEDYEGMTVLKGAAASALYGIQGANGVIMLTSKKGTKGKPSVSFTNMTTIENVRSLPEFQTDYLATKTNQGWSTETWGAKGFSEDHVKGFFDTGITNTTSFGFSTASTLGTSNLSFSNTLSDGVISGNNLAKNTFGLKQSTKFLKDKLTITANANYTSQKIMNKPVNGLYFNPITGLYLMPRGNSFNDLKENYQIFDAVNNKYIQNWMLENHDITQNPFWIINKNKSTDNDVFFNGGFALDYQMNKWINLKSRYTYNSIERTFEKKMFDSSSTVLVPKNGRYFYENDKSNQQYVDFIATLDTKINEDFSIASNIGTSLLKTTENDRLTLDSGRNNGLVFDNIFTIGNFVSNAGNSRTLGLSKEMQSIFGTANLSYKNYLFLDVTGRNDWSSTLVNTENTSFFYSSVGLTGLLNEMVKLPDFVDFSKFRITYATVGNDIPPFITSPVSRIVGGSYVQPEVGPKPGESLLPAKKKEFEVGTEWRFLKNRVGLELSYYSSTTSNQYTQVGALTGNQQGYSLYAINAGKIDNSGIELVLNGTILKNEELSWNTTLNYSHNKNTVKEIPTENKEGKIFLTDPGTNGYRYSLIEGRPFGVIEAKNFKRDAQGRILLGAKEFDGQGNLKPAIIQRSNDFEEVGNSNPDFMLGFSNNFKYEGFNLFVLVDGRFGGEVLSMTEAINDANGVSKASGDARNAGGVEINAVYPDGTPFTGKMDARTYYSQVGDRSGILGEYVYDATNISLREVSIGYDFAVKLLPFLQSASLTLVARNLGFIYKKAPFDPTIALSTGNGLQGVDIFGMPSTSSLGINLRVNF